MEKSWRFVALSVFALTLVAACTQKAVAPPPAEPLVAATDKIAAGRYLVKIGGCNDCHTAGFAEKNGDVPEENWLMGDAPGFNGPWGTTYPANLRLSVQAMDEEAWVGAMHTRKAMPPMPWPAINAMHEQDLRAIYQYIHSLGAKGVAAQAAQPPGQQPAGAYYYFLPVTGKPPG